MYRMYCVLYCRIQFQDLKCPLAKCLALPFHCIFEVNTIPDLSCCSHSFVHQCCLLLKLSINPCKWQKIHEFAHYTRSSAKLYNRKVTSTTRLQTLQMKRFCFKSPNLLTYCSTCLASDRYSYTLASGRNPEALQKPHQNTYTCLSPPAR